MRTTVPNMRGLKAILRVLAVILYLLLLVFMISLMEQGYQWYYGKENSYLITGTGLPILFSLLLFIVFLWLFSQDGLKGYFEEENGEGIKANFSTKKKCLVGLLSFFLTIAGILGSMFWFQKFSLKGIEYRCFFYQKEYTWQDVSQFILKADFQGCLVFEFQMKDGAKRSFNGGVLWCVEYFSEQFDQQFPEDVYDFAQWLGREMSSQNIPLEAEGGWNQLMEQLKYDSWKILAEDIRQCYENSR